MIDVNGVISELREAALNPPATIRASMTKTGKKAIGCFPIYAPEEVIYAAGLLPIGMWGGKRKGNLADKYLQSFCCSIMRTNMEQALAGDYDFLDGVVVTGFCDTLKCITEDFKIISKPKVISIVYPQNRKLQCGKDYFITELLKLKKEMEMITKREITEQMLSDAVDVYDDYRRAMQEFVSISVKHPTLFDPLTRHLVIKAAYFMDKMEYTAKIKTINAQLKKVKEENLKRKKVVLTGVLGEPNELLEIFNENNIQVVADDIAQETRQFRTIAPKSGTALQRMAERIALQDGCTFLYDPEKTRGDKLVELVKKYQADAIVFLQMKFCDPDEFDFPIVKKIIEKHNIPVLHLEIEQIMDSVEQLRTRIQSFAEMLD